MPSEMLRSAEEVLSLVHDEFVEPARARLKEHTHEIRKSMRDLDEYDDKLQHVLGGVGAKKMPMDDGKPVIELLWDAFRKLIPSDSLRWAALQPFTNIPFRNVPDTRGLSMWTPRQIASDYMAATDRKRIVPFDSGLRYAYNQLNSKWYYTSTRKRSRIDPDRPVGFYNLLMHPRFYEPFKSNSLLQWFPQSLLATRESDEAQADSILPTLSLAPLVRMLGGEGELDELRHKLAMIVEHSCLPAEPSWEEIRDEAVYRYHECIIDFMGKKNQAALHEAVGGVKASLVEIYKSKDVASSKLGSWHRLDDANLAKAIGHLENISDVSIVSTFLYWLMQDPGWNYYYYFVFGSTPNSSGPSLGLATSEPLSRSAQICATWMLNALGKDLAMLETQVLAAERAEERTEARIAYFSRLQTHTFTKGFTTPVSNEMFRLRGSMTDSYEQASIGRANDTLVRFEYAMQSQEYLGVGDFDKGDWRTYLVEPEVVDAKLLHRMMSRLHGSAIRVIDRRLNDLFDDPIYAKGLDALDPVQALASRPRIVVEPIGTMPAVQFFADYSLLGYHLQSLIQNAAEALDLVAAVDSQQVITVKCELRPARDDSRRHIVFTVTNSRSTNVGGGLADLKEGLEQLQNQLAKDTFDSSGMPPSKKSGGHQGLALILAAVFCGAVRVYSRRDLELRDGKPALEGVPNVLNSGRLRLHASPGLTCFELCLPLPANAEEVVRIDRRIFTLVPKKIERKEVNEAAPLYQPTASFSPAESFRVLVVDDDTADRQRFRFNIRRSLHHFVHDLHNLGHIRSSCKIDGEDEIEPDANPFNAAVVFAWDAKAGAVWSSDSIVNVLVAAATKKGASSSNRITLFLDLAWNRREEDFFDQLRRASTCDQYEEMIAVAGASKPEAFKVLDGLKGAWAAINGMVRIFVVTAYKSANLDEYLARVYGPYAEKCPEGLDLCTFMKWSDEDRLRGYLEI